MDRSTVDIYERGAQTYLEERRAYAPQRAADLDRALPAGRLRLDLGCGPGHYLPYLGRPAVAADAAPAMVGVARGRHGVPGVVCDQQALPFRHGTFGGVWASKCLQHLPAPEMPATLAGLHRVVEVGGLVDVTLFAGEGTGVSDDDQLPGRLFTFWDPDRLEDLLVGAGFEVLDAELGEPDRHQRLALRARRARSLADTVGPGMRVLVCGLNPSLYAADAGVGFARPGNRFWPAARASGLVSVDRDPDVALRRDGMGMTDLVKRATTAASELRTDEYAAGLARVERLVGWLRPGAVCFVGLAGWRAAVDRRAVPGVQPARLAGVPVYVMPSTSGLNARSSLGDLTGHLARVADLSRSGSGSGS